MDSVELKTSKLQIIQPIASMVFGLLFCNYFAFFNKHYRGNLILEIFSIAISVWVLWFIYKLVTLIKINRPIITITTTNIKFYESGTLRQYNWNEVLAWEINGESNNKYLILKTMGETKKIKVSHLNKSPQEIRKIISQFK
jgi:hypothetical protein